MKINEFYLEFFGFIVILNCGKYMIDEKYGYDKSSIF